MKLSKLLTVINAKDLSVFMRNYTAYKTRRRGTPKSVTIETTYKCNRRCRGCYIPDDYKTQNPVIESGLMQSAVDQCIETGIPFIGFAGGEPLIPQSRELIYETAMQNQKQGFFIYTNADYILQLTKELRQFHNLAYVISIDGLRETHDSIRGRGSFENVKQAMEELRNAKKIYAASVTIRPETEEEINTDDFFTLLQESGIKFARIRTIKQPGITYPDEEMLAGEVNERAKQHNISTSFALETNRAANLMIGINGDVRSTRFDLDEDFGNIRDQHLKDIIRSCDIYAAARILLKTTSF